MYRLLFAFILFISLLLNVSPVFAQEACKPMLSCADPTHIIRSENGRCAPRSVPVRPDAPAPQTTVTSGSCPEGTCANSQYISNCLCVPADSEECSENIPTSAGIDPETAPAEIVEKAKEAEAIEDAKNPEPEPDECTKDPAKCTRGSGQPCDPTTGSLKVSDPNSPNVKEGRVGQSNNSGIMTAIGCIPTQPQMLVEGLLRYGTFAAGAVAFLLMLLASLEMITGEGNAEVIKKAQEKFYSAIIGLLLVIFSVLLMQIIGVDVLGLPGFGRG